MIPPKYLAFCQLCELYLSDLERRNLGCDDIYWGTPVAYKIPEFRRMLETKVYPSIGSTQLKGFDILTHRILISDLKRLQISYTCQCAILGRVKNILLYAFRLGYISKEIAESFSIHSNSDSKYHVYSLQELKSIISAAHKIPNAEMLSLTLFTGMKRNEERALFWSDLTPETHELFVSRCIGKKRGELDESIKPQEPERQRLLRLTRQAWNILENQYSLEFPGKNLNVDSELPEQLVFHKRNDPCCFLNPADISYLLLKVKKATHIHNIGFENLRHQYALIALKETGDLIAVKTTMGYTSYCPIAQLQPYTSSIETH